MKKVVCYLLIISCLFCVLTSCGSNRVEDIITIADEVLINGEKVDTVEASMGAFQGNQGDYIEFRFPEEQTFNTIFINEKSTTVRQYNIFAEVNGKYKLIHTDKLILNENIFVETTTATAIKVQIVNTEIGNDSFMIQGINAYNITTK